MPMKKGRPRSHHIVMNNLPSFWFYFEPGIGLSRISSILGLKFRCVLLPRMGYLQKKAFIEIPFCEALAKRVMFIEERKQRIILILSYFLYFVCLSHWRRWYERSYWDIAVLLLLALSKMRGLWNVEWNYGPIFRRDCHFWKNGSQYHWNLFLNIFLLSCWEA